ncbi:MAG TPA: hypothetical protein VF414_12840 [Thermoanaerobaculia bacterium]
MLKPACRQFRAELAPGDPHRRSCPACAAYAAAMERAAFKVPLPAGLRSKLRAIPGAASPGPRLPLPQAPLPDPLRDRLRGLARRPVRSQDPRPLPAWVRTSRYAVAASYLMAVLVGLATGNPVQLGRQAAHRVSSVVTAQLTESRERLDIWEDTVRERVGETRRSLEDSLGSLDHRVDELSQSLRSLEPLITRRVQ